MPKIKHNLLNNKNISPDDYAVYVAIRCLTQYENQSLYYISKNMIGYFLYNEVKLNQYFSTKIVNSMNNLYKNKYIVGKRVDNSTILVDAAKSFPEPTRWFYIKAAWIRKIFDLNCRTKEELLYYLSYMVSIMWNKNNTSSCQRSLETLATAMNTTTQTIIRYNSILEKNSLLKISHSRDQINCNIYTLVA